MPSTPAASCGRAACGRAAPSGGARAAGRGAAARARVRGAARRRGAARPRAARPRDAARVLGILYLLQHFQHHGALPVAAASSRRTVRAGSCSECEPGRAALELTCSTHCCVEQSNRAYLHFNQGRLRAHRVWEVRDALLRGEVGASAMGERTILPVSLIGRPAIHVPLPPGVRPRAALQHPRATRAALAVLAVLRLWRPR